MCVAEVGPGETRERGTCTGQQRKRFRSVALLVEDRQFQMGADDSLRDQTDWFWSPSVRNAGRGINGSRVRHATGDRADPRHLKPLDLRAGLKAINTSRLVFAESRRPPHFVVEKHAT